MSLVLARAVGSTGRVFSFEPNVKLHPTLKANLESWLALDIANICLETCAISDRDDEGMLGFPNGYSVNNGIASLEQSSNAVAVNLRRLDSLGFGKLGLMKVDVEGHEAKVFLGAGTLLKNRMVRDIVFEEHEPYPAQTHKILEEYGYSMFRLDRTVSRPLLLPPGIASRHPSLPTNYLASLESKRVTSRFSNWGWSALSTHKRTSIHACESL